MRIEFTRDELNAHKGKIIKVEGEYEFTLKVPVFYRKRFDEDGFFIDLDEEDLKQVSHKIEIGELDFELLIRRLPNQRKKANSIFKRLYNFLFKKYSVRGDGE